MLCRWRQMQRSQWLNCVRLKKAWVFKQLFSGCSAIYILVNEHIQYSNLKLYPLSIVQSRYEHTRDFVVEIEPNISNHIYFNNILNRPIWFLAIWLTVSLSPFERRQSCLKSGVFSSVLCFRMTVQYSSSEESNLRELLTLLYRDTVASLARSS